MQEKFLGEFIFARMHVGPVFALAQKQENTLEELFIEVCIRTFSNMYSHLHPLPLYGRSGCILPPLMPIQEYFGGIDFGANTCSACIRTRANTGK